MDNKPPVDRSLIIPILISAFSVAGICLVLLALRLSAAPANAQPTLTNTPMKFQYLGTEPGIVFPTEASTPTPMDTQPPVAPTPTQEIILPTPTATRRATRVPPVVAATATATATVVQIGGVYDDADFRLAYTGNWIAQSGVSNTFKNTLHISSTIGDSVLLSFVGQKIRLVFQAGPSLGTIALRLDSVDFTLDQSATQTIASQWESPTLSLSSHSLTITHISGGSINVDSLVVVDLGTATPTVTPTATP